MNPHQTLRVCLIAAAVIAGCEHPDDSHFLGYAEGEYVRVAVPIAGRLDELSVARGAMVERGAPLFALEHARESAAVDEARHRLEEAQARLRLAVSQQRRQEDLRQRRLVSAEQLDLARTEKQRAEAAVQAAQAALAQAQWALDQKRAGAPAAGYVDDTYYRAGEWVPAGSPVVSLLPPANRKIRFFVPETVVGALKPGQAVTAACDGCAKPVRGTIRYIASEAEFTPPVIYSRERREKLVFLVEAQPVPEDALRLQPGQPLEVRLSP